MKSGISGAPIPPDLPFAAEITQACALYDFPPQLAYAIKQNETGNSTDPAEMQIGAIGDFMPDGSNAGHGPFQLTSSWPWDWYLPSANALYALEVFLVPAWDFWVAAGMEGANLAKCVGAAFNCGLDASWENHLAGNVDGGDTDNYGARVVAHLEALAS